MTDCSQAPLISVLMCVHSGRRYLSEAVDSIRAQTMRDFEFILSTIAHRMVRLKTWNLMRRALD